MAGYNGFSKSNNAVEAEGEGRWPASIAAKKLTVKTTAIKTLMTTNEYHHTSSKYNKTYYYDIRNMLSVVNNNTSHLTTDEINEAIELLASLKAASKTHKPESKIFYDCNVEWLEWSGTRNRPTATKHAEKGVKVEVKGCFYTFLLKDGTKKRKKIASTGTYAYCGTENIEYML